MTKNRLEAFSDGVIAIIITIMVLELKIPHSSEWRDLHEILPVFLSYVLSFIYIAIYWANHHHLIHTVHHVSAGIIWSNMGLLFCLSLVPFATAWMGENHFETNTIVAYAVLMNLTGLAYNILQRYIVACHKDHEHLKQVMKPQQRKGSFSLICYTAAIPLAYVHPGISAAIFVLIAVLWFIPDKNIERLLG